MSRIVACMPAEQFGGYRIRGAASARRIDYRRTAVVDKPALECPRKPYAIEMAANVSGRFRVT